MVDNKNNIKEIKEIYIPIATDLIENHHVDEILSDLSQASYYFWLDNYRDDILLSNIHSTCGETKMVFWNDNCDYVIKIPFLDDNDGFDYCKAEVRNYREANKQNLESYFAWCDKLMDYNGYPIYIMQYCECDPDEFRGEIENMYSSRRRQYNKDHEGTDSYYNEEYDSSSEEAVWDYFDEILNEQDAESLANFCFENYITDVHCANIGKLNGQIVIIDYSGFGAIKRAELPDSWWDCLQEE